MLNKCYIFVLVFIPYLAFSQPTVKLINPVSLPIMAENSEKFVDSFWIREGGSTIIHREYDTCFFVTEPYLATNCSTSLRLRIYSRHGLKIPTERRPVFGDHTCDSCPILGQWEWRRVMGYPEIVGWYFIGEPTNIWAVPDSDFLLVGYWGRDTLYSEVCPSYIETLSAYMWDIILPTLACTIRHDAFPWGYASGFLLDDHFEELVFIPFCDTLDNCTDWLLYSYCWQPHMGRACPCFEDSVYRFFPINPQVIADYHYPTGYIREPDSIYTNICSGGCGDSSLWDNRFHFLLDSTSAWMIISWGCDTDTISYGDPGTFWFNPEGFSIPWRRFGILLDSTKLPKDYVGSVDICLMDATNKPAVIIGDPVHLGPRGVYPFTGPNGVYRLRCWPSPPEPVCWSFFRDTLGRITEPIQTTSPELSLEVHDIVTDNFTLSYALAGAGELAIYDIMGHMVWRKGVTGSGSEKIECDEWRSGVYFARIRADGDRIVRRMIVIR